MTVFLSASMSMIFAEGWMLLSKALCTTVSAFSQRTLLKIGAAVVYKGGINSFSNC